MAPENMEKTVFEVWTSVYPSLADCIILALCAAMFFWFRFSLKNAITQFTDATTSNTDTISRAIVASEKARTEAWKGLAESIKKLKDDKIWKGEYILEIQNIKDKHDASEKHIEDMETRLRKVERKGQPI